MVRRLANVIAYYRRADSSTYERTKEVWGALQILLKLHESRWDDLIPLIVRRYTLRKAGRGDVEYFEKHLQMLLQKFAEEVKGSSPAMKRELAKTIRDALDVAVQNPFPDICSYLKEHHPDALERERFKECRKVVSYEPSSSN
mgnify:FL=1